MTRGSACSKAKWPPIFFEEIRQAVAITKRMLNKAILTILIISGIFIVSLAELGITKNVKPPAPWVSSHSLFVTPVQGADSANLKNR